MNTSMIVYRLFDVADEINLDLVQALWTSRNKIASRLRLDRISTKSITFKNPPVLVELGNHDLEINGKTYFTEVKARIFDIGVISLILRIEFKENVTEAEYMDMAIANAKAVGHKPEFVLSYNAFGKNESNLKNYWKDVKWYVLNSETNTIDGEQPDFTDIDFVSSVCPCAGIPKKTILLILYSSANLAINFFIYSYTRP